ncbi:MAG: hypothetical protein IJO48_02260 [Clostridia bacterium]|nr:hypothetical protein [Clostridia bacterium]
MVQFQSGRTHFSDKVKEHPVLFITALAIFILGIAAGFSSCGISYRGAVLIKTALLMENGANYNLFGGTLRSLAVNFLLYVLSTAVCVHKSLFPISLASILFCGFLAGFTAGSFLYEFDVGGILGAFLFIIPNLMTTTAMFFGFIRGCLDVKSKEKLPAVMTADTIKNGGGSEIMLLLIGIGLEGVVIPLALRILLY